MTERERLQCARRWVVKVGTALLTDTRKGLNRNAIGSLVTQLSELRRSGLEVVLVSSGSVAEGMQRLGWNQRPREIHRLQAAAAVGQMGLVRSYEAEFQQYGMHTAQVLLTHADLANRERYLNARSTLRTLLELGVIPVVNENDTVVTDEIRFGDNDTLAALVANLVDAEMLVLLTDQHGLYDEDPRKNPAARLIEQGTAGDRSLEAMAGSGGELGRGGMLTKLQAASRAARSGAATVIANGRESDCLLQLRAGKPLGTLLTPHSERLASRKQWLAGQLRANGWLVLDRGAVRVLRESGSSLLPIGVVAVEGAFSRGEIVVCEDEDGNEIARGLVNYSAEESARIIGCPSSRIESVLGYIDEPELIHRDNIVITGV
ncbi:MAG: glutamate 5-kinase [Pseudomonadota bacterium]|nr:glutamate 5-kinase [Pseudomonadota bacterium]